ncbi:MAG: hypothetical protein K2Y32_23730 [Candidatus Obscuribacterales bacterium]|nr:hypothetical protein [Candidatus Obscuribacterales bacterium]
MSIIRMGLKLQAETILDKAGDQGEEFGPSGFLELGGNTLVVDFGNILMSDTVVGFLYEDGHIKILGASEKESRELRVIDDLEDCVFRGIDSRGLELTLPILKEGGPTGDLYYNERHLTVTNGRVATADHHLIGVMDDGLSLAVRDHHTMTPFRRVEEANMLAFYFEGQTSEGKSVKKDYLKPLYRRDKSYGENEIIRYFQDFDRLGVQQKKYVVDSLNIWARAGILQVVRKSEGNCAMGNVKHGAAGVTRVRTGMVDLDAEEFDRDIDLFKRFGTLASVTSPFPPYVEVRVNLVVSHEFGHQLQFCLSQASQDRIGELYRNRLDRCRIDNPPPPGYEGYSELVRPERLNFRQFISGYSATSKEEYWAEAVAAFSIAESRQILQAMDPGICKILTEILEKPHLHFSPVLVEPILDLQASLRAGLAMPDNLLG